MNERTKLSQFIVLLNGQIESAEFPSFDNFYCKYSYVYGVDWNQVGGLHEGLSARCERGSIKNTNIINVGMPIEATFTSTNPFGWPQILLSCYGSDFFGHDVIRGYGAVHIPTTPGRLCLEFFTPGKWTLRRIAMFVPEASTPLQRFIGWITGKRAELIDPRIVAAADSRQALRMRSQGIITVIMDIVLKDMKKYGYDVIPATLQKISEFPLRDFTNTIDEQSQTQPETIASTSSSGAKTKKATQESESQTGPSSALMIPSRSESPLRTRPLPMPRQKLGNNKAPSGDDANP